MKVAEGLKIINEGWIHKPKGFRVKFHKQTETCIEPGLSPPAEAAPFTSDVTAWRYAWKLWQSTLDEHKTGTPGALYNITVVDDQDQPARFYATGKFEMYNTKNIDP